MWPEIYNFFEQYDGVSYNLVEDLQSIGGNFIFIEPYAWQSGVNNILDNLQSAIDCIEKNGQYLTEDMPDKKELKKIVATYVLSGLIENLNEIKQVLHVDKSDVSNFDDLEIQLYTVGKLVEMFVTNNLDDLLSKDLFNTYIVEDEEDDNGFISLLGLHENDVPNISMTISSIRDDYFESLNES